MDNWSLVAYTTSKKPIYQYSGKDNDTRETICANFSIADDFDAFAVFSYLQLIYWRKYGEESQDYLDGTSMLNFFDGRLSDGYIKRRMIHLRILTAFDLSNYGRKLCVSYLQELLST